MWSAILKYELKSEMQTQNIYSKKKNTIHFKKKKKNWLISIMIFWSNIVRCYIFWELDR